MMSLITDTADPQVAGISFTDHCTGIFAAYGVLGALLARERTGRGQFVDASLLQVSLAFIESHIADFLNGGETVSRDNFPRGRIFCFVAEDGLPLVVHLSGHESSWAGLLAVAGREDLLQDPRYKSRTERWEHHWQISRILAIEFKRKPRIEWLAALDLYSIANAPIHKIDEVLDDPQIRHLGMPREVIHPQAGNTRLIGTGVNLSDIPTSIFRPAPLLGEQSNDILAELGLTQEQIEDLRTSGAI